MVTILFHTLADTQTESDWRLLNIQFSFLKTGRRINKVNTVFRVCGQKSSWQLFREEAKMQGPMIPQWTGP